MIEPNLYYVQHFLLISGVHLSIDIFRVGNGSGFSSPIGSQGLHSRRDADAYELFGLHDSYRGSLALILYASLFLAAWPQLVIEDHRFPSCGERALALQRMLRPCPVFRARRTVGCRPSASNCPSALIKSVEFFSDLSDAGPGRAQGDPVLAPDDLARRLAGLKT